MLEVAAVARGCRQQHGHIVPALEGEAVELRAAGEEAKDSLCAAQRVAWQENLQAAALFQYSFRFSRYY